MTTLIRPEPGSQRTDVGGESSSATGHSAPTAVAACCRGVRGAVCAAENSAEAIISATTALLRRMLADNGIACADIGSIFFTATPDLDAAFPAAAARDLGLEEVALLCSQEIAAPAPVQRCIRVMLHWNTSKSASEIVHVYIGEAAALRPERAALPAPGAAAQDLR